MHVVNTIRRRWILMWLLLVGLTVAMSAQAAPSRPDGLRYDVYSDTTAELFWLRSSDRPLVAEYELSRDGVILGVFDALSYVDTSLAPGISYLYEIIAIDVFGGRSDASSILVNVPASLEDQIARLRQRIAELEAQPNSGLLPISIAASGEVAAEDIAGDSYAMLGAAVEGERFTDNNDGTFTDRLTEITWLGVRNCIVRFDWVSAIQYANTLSDENCSGLNDGSVAGDWRIPTILELQSLLDYSRDSPALADGIPYTGNWSENPWTTYWSSTSFGPAPTLNGWRLYLDYGWTSFGEKQNSHYSWPIRAR